MTVYMQVTSQGQISVPVEVRRALGVELGGVLAWEPLGDGYVVRQCHRYTLADLRAVAQRYRRADVPTLAEMDEAEASGVTERHGRSR
jgi:bifunctional DNA-binding transcriptional regulator/antitoxin component of YhaV-PrlF toxin-antitoxin module